MAPEGSILRVHDVEPGGRGEEIGYLPMCAPLAPGAAQREGVPAPWALPLHRHQSCRPSSQSPKPRRCLRRPIASGMETRGMEENLTASRRAS